MPDSIGSTLPRTVVREDHRLEKETEQSSSALAALRWHWTLDETNPKRVSFSEYARAVGKGASTVRQYARGFALRSANPGMTSAEAQERSKMGVETETVAEAIAEARGIGLPQVSKTRQTEVKRVRELARERAEKNQTSVEEEAPKVADWIVKSEKADARQTKERKQRLGLRYVEIEGKLARMKALGTDVLNLSHDVDFGSDEMELLSHSLEAIKALLSLIDLRLAGAADVDWDAELAKLDKGLAA